MRVCLVPLRIIPGNSKSNLEHFFVLLPKIKLFKPDLVCLPECTFSGYIFEEQELLHISEPVPGNLTQIISAIAKQLDAAICFGVLEADNLDFYITQLLIERNGDLRAKQRKISEKPPFKTVERINTFTFLDFNIALVTCGDLFTPDLPSKINGVPNLIINSMSRSFDNKSPNLNRWNNFERKVYLERVRELGITTLIVNSLEDCNEGAFGGALVIDPSGNILAEAPHGSDEILFFDLPETVK